MKPANVMVADKLELVKLTDFSISSWLPEENRMLMPPDVMKGTAAYISPEQVRRVSRTLEVFTTLLESLGSSGSLYSSLTQPPAWKVVP